MTRTMVVIVSILAILVTLAMPVWGANTELWYQGFGEVTFDGSTNWTLPVSVSSRFHSLVSIQFYPAAQNDVVVVRAVSATGPSIMKAKDTTGGGVLMYFEDRIVPYVKGTEAPAGSKLLLHLR